MLALGLAIIIAVADQWTKLAIRTQFRLGESRGIIPGFFHLTYVRNTGAAWGLLGGYNNLLVVLSAVMLGVLLLFRRSFLSDSIAHRIALGLLVGGILGNLLDRVRLEYVVDFLDFHLRGYHFPAFNVADAAICVGIGLYLLTSNRPMSPGQTQSAPG